tara:strand:- start:50553 stop:51509 length:957 start_codon:yes stop_codon:yes gene_type:complete
MRAPESVVTTLAPLKLATTDDTPFFSNSGLVDYKQGISLPVSGAVTPPVGPADTPAQLIVETKALSNPRRNEPMTAEEAAAQFARQITRRTNAQAADPDVMKLHTEFKSLSNNGRLPTFQEWVGADINRKVMFKAGAERILEKQYQDLIMEKGKMTDWVKKQAAAAKAGWAAYNAHGEKDTSTSTDDDDDKKGDSNTGSEFSSSWTPNTKQPLNTRLVAVEEQMKHMAVGMDNHTYHLRQLKEGMENHTEVLQHTVTGLHNHTEVLNKTVTGMHSHTKKLRELTGQPVESQALMTKHRQAMGTTGKSVMKASDLLTDL